MFPPCLLFSNNKTCFPPSLFFNLNNIYPTDPGSRLLGTAHLLDLVKTLTLPVY